MLDKFEDKIEKPGVKFFPVFSRSIDIDGRVDIFEMSLENTIGFLAGNIGLKHINIPQARNYSIFNHIKETSPDHCSSESVFNFD